VYVDKTVEVDGSAVVSTAVEEATAEELVKVELGKAGVLDVVGLEGTGLL